MKRIVTGCALAAFALALAAGRPAAAQDLQQKLAAAKQNAAQNQQALRAYTWIEKVELSLKGEVKNTTVNSCRYGPDGKGEPDRGPDHEQQLPAARTVGDPLRGLEE